MSDLPRARSPPQVKICGIRTPEDLTAADGADLMGVVVDVAGSPRTRSLAQASDLFRRAEGRYLRVAVVVSPSKERVQQILSEAAPDFVQVHGDLPSGLSEAQQRRLIPSIAIMEGISLPEPRDLPHGKFPWFHLDRGGGPLPGGTGQAFPWNVGRALVESHPGRRFMLAGGLTPENVRSAVHEVRPQAVDVSSGVESRPGEKSRAKIERFLAAVRAPPD